MPRTPRVRASRPAAAHKSCMPWNGMQWGQGRVNITPRRLTDVRVLGALRSLGVSIRKRDVQIELTNLVEEATAFAQRMVCVPDRDIERSEFLAKFRGENRLGELLSPAQFEQLFTTIVLARYRYLEDRYLEDLPVESPATHCHLARAVDAFEATAWFWSSVEAFLEDDQGRGDDAESLAAFSSDSDENDQDRAAASLAVTTIAAANDPAYVSLAAGVDVMDLDDVAGDVGSEMEVDD
ncbi:uncharacterized protein B0H64DRAFT_463321 [Chaetomium fimeti]|uniref:Uncharacterized protein n=1 Tax=Chaetomium fimeti TaxID=1854472 RepID=A0AAE0LRP9_9PEZI|nr:hypothetical protein B0H64DRAFT_463321 [Chaetomium fimeti]